VRAYNESLGAEPPAASRGRAPAQGIRGKAPMKLRHSLFRCPKEGEIWPIVEDFSVVVNLVEQSKCFSSIGTIRLTI